MLIHFAYFCMHRFEFERLNRAVACCCHLLPSPGRDQRSSQWPCGTLSNSAAEWPGYCARLFLSECGKVGNIPQHQVKLHSNGTVLELRAQKRAFRRKGSSQLVWLQYGQTQAHRKERNQEYRHDVKAYYSEATGEKGMTKEVQRAPEGPGVSPPRSE